VLVAGAVEVNALAQGALRQYTQRLWNEHPTLQLGGGHLPLLQAGLPETTHLAHKAKHAAKPASLRQLKQS